MRIGVVGLVLLVVVGCGDDFDRTRAASGSLDARFGTGGIVLTDLGAGHNRIRAVVPLADGRILVGGTASRGGLSVALARYDAHGHLDPSFGTDGFVVTPEAQGPALNGAEFRDLAFASRDDIVTVACVGVIPPCDWAVTRHSFDGVPDRTFGGGVVIVAGGWSPAAIVGSVDGGVVVLGLGMPDERGETDYVLLKLTATGEPDPAFGVGGRVEIDVADDAAGALLALPDGRLLVGGGSGGSFTVLRLLANGALDASFGQHGAVVMDDPGLAGTIGALAAGPHGTFVAGGTVESGNGAVVRFDGEGVLDDAFGIGGIAVLGAARRLQVHELAVAPDGSIVATAPHVEAHVPVFALLRLDPSGVRDESFGADGLVTTPIGALAESDGIGIAPDGAIIVGGLAVDGGSTYFALARYRGPAR